MDKFYRTLLKIDELKLPVKPLVSMVVDLAYRNPRVYPIAFAVISKLLTSLEVSEQQQIVDKIQSKFRRLPNTGYMQIFLQRVSKPLGLSVDYDEPLCRLVDGAEIVVWRSDWINYAKLRKVISEVQIVDREILASIDSVVPVEDVNVFSAYDC